MLSHAPSRADAGTRVYDSVLEMLPDVDNPTPLVRINALTVPGSTLYAKLEWMNPFGSVKDRAAWEMLRDLERRGELGAHLPRRGIVEPTSGNTGFSLAVLAGVSGYHMRAVVPSKVPIEKRALMRLAGAEVDVVSDALCPLPGSEDGALGLARSHARAQPDRYVMPNQYENDANVRAHERTTGPEIWRQSEGRVTHVFVTLGTCGTAMGIARYLRSVAGGVKVIAVQPSPGHDVPGLRAGAELGVSKLLDRDELDEIVEVPFEKAYTNSAELLRHEGLRAGPSSGLVFEGARRYALRSPVAFGVMIFCDDVFKYMSKVIEHLPELSGDAGAESAT
ncbi:MAG: PLP-dependent cysteine synthase family protein [Phycisphaerales bacterium]